MSLPWFRFYHEFAGDPGVQCLSFDDQRHFVMTLCLKASGFLDRPMPSSDYRHRAICRALGLDVISGTDALKRLQDVGLNDAEWQPIAWDKRQFKSDNSTSRVRKFRESKKEEDIDTDTEANVSVTPKKRFIKKKSSRVPEDFQPDRELALREVPDLDVDREIQKFRDWEFKNPRSDWPATWRNWVERCRETKQYAKRPLTGRVDHSEWR